MPNATTAVTLPSTTPRWVVLTSAAPMPSSCWGRYVRVALVLMDPAALPAGRRTPAMISERARGVVRIDRTWERLHDGGARSASARARAEALAIAAARNAEIAAAI